ncbi:hypothetical protein OGAPHI_007042 [Ogataea philodendri]|uniref:Uncharacterized protein n=1 Tax=Ogataea philodendri TaxID=1378263 RepID=A0A9P8T0C5_9ASCO|nr:uncharacterized protein OGAPHI_007042 [Ogataea philodendri]KAH3660456.1 hypothetical protein OGAPHI_007042 [Ogataea philodendri]
MNFKIIYTCDELLSLQHEGVLFKNTELPNKEFWRFNVRNFTKTNGSTTKSLQKSHNNYKKKAIHKSPSEDNFEEETPEWLDETDFKVDSSFVGYSSIGTHSYEEFEREKKEFHRRHGGFREPQSLEAPVIEHVPSSSLEKDFTGSKTAFSSAEDSQFDQDLELRDHLNGQFFDNLLKNKLEPTEKHEQPAEQKIRQIDTSETSKFERLFQAKSGSSIPIDNSGTTYTNNITNAPIQSQNHGSPFNNQGLPTNQSFGNLPPGIPLGPQSTQMPPMLPPGFNSNYFPPPPPPPPELLKLIQEGKLPPLPGMPPGLNFPVPQMAPQMMPFPTVQNKYTSIAPENSSGFNNQLPQGTFPLLPPGITNPMMGLRHFDSQGQFLESDAKSKHSNFQQKHDTFKHP